MHLNYVCFVGASSVEGMGDEAGLGWVGRLRYLNSEGGGNSVVYNLGVRGQTTEMIAARWQAECAARLPASGKVRPLIVLSIGVNDMGVMPSGEPRLGIDGSIAALSKIIKEAAAIQLPILCVGPTPVLEEKMPFYSVVTDTNVDFDNARIEKLDLACKSLCADTQVPYLSLYAYFSGQEAWFESLAKRDGLHVDGCGYQMVADYFKSWSEWSSRTSLG